MDLKPFGDNDRCQPFAWTKDAGELVAKIRPSKN
jgi:hypothetical protein